MDAVAVGTVIAGRYTVTAEIGRGGMGVVYRVEHVHTGEQLALKVLIGGARSDPQAVARFKREARASAKIRSDHVVRVTDADTAPELGGSPFIVMELLRGVDLAQYIVRRGALSPSDLVLVVSQVGNVLETAHRLGIVHRDLKPENLFLHQRDDGKSITKVLDFGISKFASAATAIESAGMTSTGSVLGTPLYMAPEQANGENDKIAPTTDVWAMGLVVLRLLTGEHYWGEPTMSELMMKIAVKPIIPPSERWPNGKHMSPALDAWFLRSCARDQAARFQSIEEQVRELASALQIDRTSLPSVIDLPLPDADIEHAATEQSPQDEEKRVGNGTELVALLTDRPKAHEASRSRRTRMLVLGVFVVAALGAMAIFLAVRTPRSPPEAPSTSDSAPKVKVTTLMNLPAPPTKVPEAAKEYAAGMKALHEDNWHRGHAHFARAAELDPEMAAAHMRVVLSGRADVTDEMMRALFATAAAHRADLTERDRALLMALEPVRAFTQPNRNECMARLETLTKRYPADAEIYMWIALTRYGQPGCLEAATHATELDPDDAQSWETKGSALLALGRVDDARISFERSIALGVDSPDPYAGLSAADELEGRCADYERNQQRAAARGFGPSLFSLISAKVALRRSPESIQKTVAEALKSSEEARSHRTLWAAQIDSQLAIADGDFLRAEELLKAEAAAIATDESSTDYQPHYALAMRLVP